MAECNQPVARRLNGSTCRRPWRAAAPPRPAAHPSRAALGRAARRAAGLRERLAHGARHARQGRCGALWQHARGAAARPAARPQTSWLLLACTQLLIVRARLSPYHNLACRWRLVHLCCASGRCMGSAPHSVRALCAQVARHAAPRRAGRPARATMHWGSSRAHAGHAQAWPCTAGSHAGRRASLHSCGCAIRRVCACGCAPSPDPNPIMCAQVSSFGSLPRVRSGGSMAVGGSIATMSKVESIASSAVRVAEKIQACRRVG